MSGTEEEDESKVKDDGTKGKVDEPKGEDDGPKGEDDESKGEDVEPMGSRQVKLEEESVKEAKVEGSPVMGLLSAKSETKGDSKDKIPTEDMIKEAIWNKADYFRSKSEYVN